MSLLLLLEERIATLPLPLPIAAAVPTVASRDEPPQARRVRGHYLLGEKIPTAFEVGREFPPKRRAGRGTGQYGRYCPAGLMLYE